MDTAADSSAASFNERDDNKAASADAYVTETPSGMTTTVTAEMPATDILPSINISSTSPITFRILVSSSETGCLIGPKGAVIGSIRAETSTRAVLSKFLPGCHERILTVSGGADDTARALSYFAQALVNTEAETLAPTYLSFPLKKLLPIANVPGSTTVLRLLVPNTHMGTLMGARGARIQEIQRRCNVVMTASKLVLPELTERLVELQGAVDNLYDALRLVLRCLLEDSPAELIPYVPLQSRGGVASDFKPSSSSSGSSHGGSSTGSSRITESIPFANDMVGAMIGKHGSRIQGVRKVSGVTIAIGEESDGERLFKISGMPRAVEKAKRLLFYNLEREEQRRAEEEISKIDPEQEHQKEKL